MIPTCLCIFVPLAPLILYQWHIGVRSMRACLILEKAGAHGLKSLAGGIAAVPSSYITAPDSGK
ncbi:Hypothetical protein Cp106_0359 [Corynebacterium pseudotuberculosis 1/06-A]|nr:Hypothetical protein Cp106_0359 [Corynebacterium pseudotuberculosis 1/06-A]